MFSAMIQYCALLLPIICFSELITVDTSRGSVQGFDHDFGGDKSQRFYGYGQIFLGIPYAKAPLGERRFTLPEDICQYNDEGKVHNATYYRPRCWQHHKEIEMDEDCLFINVMSPNISGNYPVMVNIPPGSFTTGGAEKYHWKGAIRNLVSRGVVVVTFQYRINMPGFFTTFTENFPPNRGLYDQILALRWVNEEIANFGGDTGRITIFGQSAGSTSVADLSLSPLARGLFHQVIMTSGSTLQEIEVIDDPRGSVHQNRAQQICQINSTDWGSAEKDEALLDCLLNTDPKDFAFFDLPGEGVWNPAIDGSMLPDKPEKLAENRPKYPTIMADMLEEFASFLPGVQAGFLPKLTSQSNQQLLQRVWPNYDDATAKNFSDTMIDGYSNGVVPDDDDHMGWTRLITDMNTGLMVSSMLIRDVQWHRKAGNEDIWLFTFAHRSMLAFSVDIDGWIPVMHGSELSYLWFYPNTWENYNATEADFAVADYMGAMWTDFAKNGALPLPKAGEAMNYVEIGDLLTLKRNWRQTADEVYNKQIPSYIGEYPPLQMTNDSVKKVKGLGEKVLAKWNSMKCDRIATPEMAKEATTKGAAPAIFTLPISVLIVLLSI